MALGRLRQPASPLHRPQPEKRRRPKIAVAAPPPLTGGRQPSKEPGKQSTAQSPSPRFAQVAGEKTAECGVVCCCFPCGLVNLFYAVAVKLPAGLLRRAVVHRRRRRKKAESGGCPPPPKAGPFSGYDEDLSLHHGVLLERRSHHYPPRSATASPDLVRLEEEMIESFRDLGFWRSPSQRERERGKQ